MQDYEKLGAFYLGRAEKPGKHDAGAATVLYDSKDLTTHAVIIGMTGSGKTGLGVGLIEEAALDAVPVIAIDPKGDLGNLLLTFPDLAASDFEPWVDAQQAATQGQTPAEFAQGQADLWKKGLADWDQDGARIQRLKDAAEFAIFTPGSSAGIPISVLGSFSAPAQALRDDVEAFAERIQATATSILTLLDMDADPLTSPAHILIANILQHTWQAGGSLDLAGLIGAIQNPPIDRIGVMDLEAIYPAKDRFALAMKLNNVLASPGFSAWTQGVPLSAQGLFYTAEGKPRVSIVSIAHLTDTERMFLVTLLLNDIIAWMRAQSGTSSLRAILYMDELFGYMPPTANPPSKNLFLTLLKQARAYGLGLVLSTQNPVDLDYKGLSNTGTWFIGRLQTDRDKARVLDGLEGAGSGGGPFDRGAMEQTLAGLGKRTFLLHNVHESNPVVFSTRWALSYLPGPLTREQIRRLSEQVAMPAIPATATPATVTAPPAATATPVQTQPVLAPGIRQFYCPATDGDGSLVYYPQIAGAADVVYASKTHNVDTRRDYLVAVDIDDGPVALDWQNSSVLGTAVADLADLTEQPQAGAAFADVPAPARDAGIYKKWASGFKTWLRQSQGITLYKSKPYKLTSAVDESETDFRIRVLQTAREQRDLAVGKLRERYEKKAGGLHDKLADAEQDIAAEKAQANQKTMESALSIGGALLGAFLGRKTVSTTNVRRIGTAARRAGSVAKERRDVRDAETKAADLRAEIDESAETFESEVAAIDALPAADALELEPIAVRATSRDITVHFVALLWLPYRQAADGRTTRAWDQSTNA